MENNQQFSKQTNSIADSLDSDDFVIGKKYFIRTATYHHVGTFERMTMIFGIPFVCLVNCKFVTESGELAPVFNGKSGLKAAESEPDIKIQLAFISDFSEASLVK